MEDGTILGEAKGGKGSVRSPLYFKQAGAVFTHIHPREAGILGGTFSPADLRNWGRNPAMTTRAVAKEGTYSITKTKKFDNDGFQQYVIEQKKLADDAYTARSNEITQRYYSGEITRAELDRLWKQNTNTWLVDLHNRYAAGQKKYGYFYTLEKRGK